MGTVDFASPEQLSGGRTDARSDVYALGCVLYAALAGEPPFARETVPAAIHAQLYDPTPKLGTAMDRVLARALAKDPADRYPSAGDLGRAALATARGERVTEEERTVARGDAAPSPHAHTVVMAGEEQTVLRPQPPPLNRRKRRGVLSLALVCILGLAAVGAIAIAGAGTDPPPAVEAVTDAEVRSAVGDFARAYSHEDTHALTRLLTADVIRALPDGLQKGRKAVVAEYARQFASMHVTQYEVSDLEISAGEAGRAAGDYEVHRRGAGSFGGTFVLGIVKENGRVRIRMIAAVPA
jgi:serine/threonine-protein kinase